MSYSYDEMGKFADAKAAEDWARRNDIDPRDLHIRQTRDGVDVAVRKGARGNDGDYSDRYNGRRDGFWR
jgi:hypothetical protein